MKNANQAQRGFTLIEVLVASLIILVMILATVSVMRHGQQVQALDQQRNRVRQFLVSQLEKPEFAHARFDSVALGTLTDSLILDDRGTPGGGDDLKASIVTTIDSAITTIDTVQIPRKRIQIRADWTSIDGSETLTLEKWICKVLL